MDIEILRTKARERARLIRSRRTPEEKRIFYDKRNARQRERYTNDAIYRAKVNSYNQARWNKTILAKRYNLTLEEYENLFVQQEGKCAVCDKTENLGVDHDHKTGKVRGLLCVRHNTLLGYLENEPNIINRLEIYTGDIYGTKETN